ncbi:hypothetical protein PoB_006379600 [Plakobranchus ocellatus]|uniref:Uncharacterized protein n=1 Tax=Plakobranchus ocellatus TaxID=259542 RepID=A0AAV4CZY1_9GAST|nr:hypothetical protein PoB_006379600 [Plakobranchus ocellatus]
MECLIESAIVSIGQTLKSWLDFETFIWTDGQNGIPELSGHYERGYSFLATISKEIEDDDFSTTVNKIIHILSTHLSSRE